MFSRLRSGVRGMMVLCVLFGALCIQSAGWGDEGELRAGLARVKITPDEPIHMAGYASRDKPSEGVLVDLYAKALVIEDGRGERGVMLTVDVIGFGADVAQFICEKITEKTKLARRQIVLCPSHTHTGPVIGMLGSMGYGLEGKDAEVVHRYCLRLAEQLAEISAEALGDLQPAKVSWGVGVTSIVMNRREFTDGGVQLGFNPRGYVDRSVPVLRVDTPDGKARAIVFGCACHNTTLTGQHYVLSGDYAGFAQQYVEKEYPGAQAMFVIGCGGSANPYPRGTLEDVQQHGHSLGTEVCRVITEKLAPVRGPLKISLDDAQLPLEPVPPREKLVEMAKGPSYVAYNAKKMLEAVAKGEPLPAVYAAPVSVWQFGNDLTWVALSGEVVNEYVPLIESAIGHRKLWISAYAHDCYGYLPTAPMLKEGGYETRCLYNKPGFFPPEAQDVLVNKVREMAIDVGRKITEN